MSDSIINVPTIQGKTGLANIDDTGKNNFENTSQPSGWSKIQSRYLGSRTGSCHDLCKFRKNDASKAKKYGRIPKSLTSIDSTRDSITNLRHSDSKGGVSPSSKKVGVSLQLGQTMDSPKLRAALAENGTTRTSLGKRVGFLGTSPAKSFNGRTESSAESGKAVGFLRTSPAKSFNGRTESSAEREKASVRRVASITARNTINYMSPGRASDLKNEQLGKKPQPEKVSRINEETPGKTLYIIESTAKYAPVEAIHPPIRNSKQSEKKSVRHTLSPSPDPVEIKTRDPEKLSFQRGVVSGIDGRERDDSLRRLAFLHGRTVGKDQSEKGNERLTFTRREEDENHHGDTEGECEKVVLKHQDVEEKKDGAHGLFNNVIEVTVSRLVESRKSKVKALVGAFETVISLQDPNSPAP